MIIWRGWGFITPLLLFLPFVGIFMAGMMTTGLMPDHLSAIPFLISLPLGMVVSGVVCWKVGSMLNQGRPYEYAHTTWFVRIEHWGIVAVVFAVPVGALCLLILGLVLQFSKPDKPGADRFAGDAGEQGPVEKPEPPYTLPRPEQDAAHLAAFKEEDLGADKLALFARAAIAEQDVELAAALQREAIEKGSDQLYNLACYESLCGRIDSSIYWLQEAALKEGVNVDWSQEDSDLENLRADPRWDPLLKFLKQCGRYWAASGAEDHQLVLPAGYSGQPIPVMVWLHGMGDRAESYIFPELQQIADQHQVAFVSVSGPVVNGPTSYSWSDDMQRNEARIDAAFAKFADQLKPLEGQIALGGFSQGGQVAGELVANKPKRYSGALIMSPGGFTPSLDDLEPADEHRRQIIIAVCGAGEHPGNVRMTKLYADWFEDAGATVTHKPYDELDHHSLVPDFEECLPEWIPDLLLVADAPAPAGSP
jgi:predicted esterase